MKKLAVILFFTLFAGASLDAQRDSVTDGWSGKGGTVWDFPGSHFNDFAVNGKFYHDIKLVRIKNGIAELNSKEGSVSTSWGNLPHVFQHAYASEKANADAQEATKSKTGTAQSDADRSPAGLVGMSESELTGLFGPPERTVPDPVFTGCFDLNWWAKSLADGQLIGVHAEVMDGTCLGILYVKAAADKSPLAPEDIARWMLTYTQGTAAHWKQDGLNKWVLDRGAGVPYTFRAERLQPNTFSIDTQELFDRSSKAKQRLDSDVQKIPGLSATPSASRTISGEGSVPGLNNP